MTIFHKLEASERQMKFNPIFKQKLSKYFQKKTTLSLSCYLTPKTQRFMTALMTRVTRQLLPRTKNVKHYFFLENSRLVIFQLKFTVLQSRRNAVKAIRGFPQVTEVKIKEVGRQVGVDGWVQVGGCRQVGVDGWVQIGNVSSYEDSCRSRQQ